MKKLTLVALAAMTLFAVAPAQGSGKMGSGNMGKAHQMHGNMAHGMKMGQMGAHDCCMMGLSAAEKKQAMAMMKSWDAGEQKAWDHRCTMCMADPHTALAKMNPKDVTPKMVHDHMMSGLSDSEKKSMEKLMGDKKNMAVMHKMVENCCMYGMKHGAKMPMTKPGKA